jgi:hypothetical protein
VFMKIGKLGIGAKDLQNCCTKSNIFVEHITSRYLELEDIFLILSTHTLTKHVLGIFQETI